MSTITIHTVKDTHDFLTCKCWKLRIRLQMCVEKQTYRVSFFFLFYYFLTHLLSIDSKILHLVQIGRHRNAGFTYTRRVQCGRSFGRPSFRIFVLRNFRNLVCGCTRDKYILVTFHHIRGIWKIHLIIRSRFVFS